MLINCFSLVFHYRGLSPEFTKVEGKLFFFPSRGKHSRLRGQSSIAEIYLDYSRNSEGSVVNVYFCQRKTVQDIMGVLVLWGLSGKTLAFTLSERVIYCKVLSRAGI